MRTRFALPYGMLSVVGAILVLAGCSRRTADPLTGPSPFPTARGALESSASLPVQDPVVEFGPPLRGGAFVDLASGRLTRADFLIRIRTQQPTGPPEPWFEVHRDSRNWRITRDVERNGLRYVVEEMTVSEFPGDPFETWFRQDRSGLFVYQEDLEPGEAVEQTSSGGGQFQSRMNAWLDSRPRSPEERTALLAATDRIAARRAAIASALGRPWEAGEGLPIVRSGPGGGPAQAEITFLRYPLHPGARWDGRIGFNVWTVEALEWLSTPAGRFASARLRIDLPELFGPADVYRTWFARPGEVQRRAHFEDEVIGEDGNPKAIVEVEELLDLVEYVPGTAD